MNGNDFETYVEIICKRVNICSKNIGIFLDFTIYFIKFFANKREKFYNIIHTFRIKTTEEKNKWNY